MNRFNVERYKQLKKEQKLTNEDIIRKLKNFGIDMPLPTLKSYTASNKNIPKPQTIKAFAEILGVPVYELNNELKQEIDRINENFEIQINENLVPYKFLNAGAGAEAYNNLEMIYIDPKVLPYKMPKYPLFTRVIGDSMTPTIHEDDLLIIDEIKNRDVKLVDGVYLIRIGDYIQIKRLQFMPRTINIISDNKLYNPQEVSYTDCELLGKMYIHININVFTMLEEY